MNDQSDRKRVVTVTLNPTIDKTFSVAQVVAERKLDCDEVRNYPGGGGINVARAATRLGDQPLALWSCGGEPGNLLRRLLDEEGVRSRPIGVRESVRENLVVRERSTECHYRFGLPGPRLSDDELELWSAAVAALDPAPDYLVLSGSLPPGATPPWFAALVRAAPRSSRVIVDTKREALLHAIEHGVFLIKPNLHELAEISSLEVRDEDSVERAARDLIDQGSVEAVLVSLGRGGALLVTRGEAHRLPAPPVPLKSKVGAGDSMVGGLVTALAKGWPLLEAARLGVAAGAAAVMTEGTELCRREDTERIYAQIRREAYPGASANEAQCTDRGSRTARWNEGSRHP